MSENTGGSIDNVMQESRLFPPSDQFLEGCEINSMAAYQELYDKAAADPVQFWGDLAKEDLHWFEAFEETLDWKEPYAEWFVGGKTNVSYNCLDRNLAENADKTAIIWEGEPGDVRTFTYRELHSEVSRLANAFKKAGVEQGDVVSIYMPMVPELAFAMLACARIGAVHSVIFAGFSAESIADRNNDASAKVQLTADGGYRRGKVLALKDIVDEALEKSPTIETCIVLNRTDTEVSMKEGRDIWWHELLDSVDDDCPATPLDSESPLFILYTSGSTGKPKGIKHTTAGYNLYAKKTFEWVFDIREDDIYWCTADLGWITGHSYIIYGPLSNRATTLMFEGVPNYPDFGRFWDVVDKHKVNQFYTAPTALRALMKEGDEWVKSRDLSSLKLLGTVGEPIKEPEWKWYFSIVGNGNCPIVDTWWQTETGGILISPFPGATPTKPGSATFPFFGVQPVLLSEEGNEISGNDVSGLLALKTSWPGQMRTIYGDHARFIEVYFSQFPGYYFTGDGAKRDEDGYYWITGRVDDVLNVSGHRIGTAEVEGAIGKADGVAEAAVVGFAHDIKGQGIYAFVTLMTGTTGSDEVRDAILTAVIKEIGPHSKPDKIQFTPALPKTRSGKIMRRILRKIAEGDLENLGDISTLADPGVVQNLTKESL